MQKKQRHRLDFDSACTYLNEVEQEAHKENMGRLQRKFELRHRLACIADDIELIDRHIQIIAIKNLKNQVLMPMVLFMQTTWHNVLEIACDLNDDEPLNWGSKVMAEKKLYKMKLSLTLHENLYVESDESFDGTNLNELVEQFKGLLVNAGFHPSNVDDMFNTGTNGLRRREE